ncbi:filamentous growth regulator 23-like [Cucumis melo var. makuwa]|uniref:Filamentous growth regulator 23-like n=1 Tax=Cucumis melo var. makuwa TaxID=1194695 RepID=A0A5A7UMJ1_CUCMM|nr:filamentous growth regulator 23-like [Cucumis melo var. makuwa]
MESQIQGDDNIEIEDNESMPDINSSDTNTPTDTMNNQSSDHNDLNNLRSTSSPLLQYNENVGGLNSAVQLSLRRKERQTVVDKSKTHRVTNKKCLRSNDKPEQSHLKSYKKIKNDINKVRKDLSTLTSIVCRMDHAIRKQSLELSEIKYMLERLVQVNFGSKKYFVYQLCNAPNFRDWDFMLMDLEVTVQYVVIIGLDVDHGIWTGKDSESGFGCTRLICASFGSTRLICSSFGSTRPICASFGSTRLMCASFGSTRLICASFGSTRLICASFGSTRLICAFYGTTRLLCRVRAQRGADRREAGRTREGHMDASGFLIASAMYFVRIFDLWF